MTAPIYDGLTNSQRYYKRHRTRVQISQRAYHQRNKVTRNAASTRYRLSHPNQYKDTHLRTTYGISLKDFRKLTKLQCYKCKICKKSKRLCVDHDHITKKVRGLLCDDCNVGIGRFKDSATNLKRAWEYLK